MTCIVDALLFSWFITASWLAYVLNVEKHAMTIALRRIPVGAMFFGFLLVRDEFELVFADHAVAHAAMTLAIAGLIVTDTALLLRSSLRARGMPSRDRAA
jgi:hypothetical protein